MGQVGVHPADDPIMEMHNKGLQQKCRSKSLALWRIRTQFVRLGHAAYLIPIFLGIPRIRVSCTLTSTGRNAAAWDADLPLLSCNFTQCQPLSNTAEPTLPQQSRGLSLRHST